RRDLRDEHLLHEPDDPGVERNVDRPVRAEHPQLEAEQSEQSGQCDDEGVHVEPDENPTVDQACDQADTDGSGHRQPSRPAELRHADGEHRGGDATDRTDGEIDLGDEQHEHDAERDDADGCGVGGQVDEVPAGKEYVVQDGENGPDRNHAADDRQGAQISAANAARESFEQAGPLGAVCRRCLFGSAGIADGRLCFYLAHCCSWSSWAARRCARRVTTLSVAPVIAATISSPVVDATSNTPLFWPSRSTTARSATSW